MPQDDSIAVRFRFIALIRFICWTCAQFHFFPVGRDTVNSILTGEIMCDPPCFAKGATKDSGIIQIEKSEKSYPVHPGGSYT